MRMASSSSQRMMMFDAKRLTLRRLTNERSVGLPAEVSFTIQTVVYHRDALHNMLQCQEVGKFRQFRKNSPPKSIQLYR
jgi:hypothetical protein